MNKYFIYIFSPLFYFCIALAGRFFTAQGIDPWYQAIAKPSFTPPGSVIGIVWTLIYILTAISMILFTNTAKGKANFWPVFILYIANGIINAAWSYIFFTKHLLGPAVVNAALISGTVMLMILFVWPHSKKASLLLFPYLGWVSFATYLTYVIFRMN